MATILLVDDEPDILHVVGFRLEKAGYTVLRAPNGEDALYLYDKEKPDLVLLDVMMPKMDGFEVCSRIKEGAPEQRIIIYTAKVDGVNAAKAKECGADDFTVKTADMKYILESVSSLLE